MFEDSTRFACDATFPAARILRLSRQQIARFELDLTGLTVLVEAATGYYRVTPVIAALAGARRVLAMARHTQYGTVDQVREQTDYLAEMAGCKDRIEIVTTRTPEVFGEADLITNLGGVRPVDETVVKWLKPTAVVSLMFGANDWRAHEVDLSACWERDIPVAGVDEVAIDLFRFTGLRLTWFLLELGVEIVGCRLVLWGEGPVLGSVMAFLSRMGATVLAVTQEASEAVIQLGGHKVAEQIATPEARNALRAADALLTFDPLRQRHFIGRHAELTAQALADLGQEISVINYSGYVDRASLQDVGINCFPRYDPGGGHSANTIGEILPAPVIELHTAGLKVGEIMARARLAGRSMREAELAALESGLGEDLRSWWARRTSRQSMPPSHHSSSESGSLELRDRGS
jgi:hypothetical protein